MDDILVRTRSGKHLNEHTRFDPIRFILISYMHSLHTYILVTVRLCWAKPHEYACFESIFRIGAIRCKSKFGISFEVSFCVEHNLTSVHNFSMLECKWASRQARQSYEILKDIVWLWHWVCCIWSHWHLNFECIVLYRYFGCI